MKIEDTFATPVGGLGDMFKQVAEEQRQLHAVITSDDEYWSQIGEHPGYKVLKKYITSLIDGLDEMEGKAFEAGASLSEIGLRRAVNRLTSANLRSIINKIEKTTDLVNEKRREVTSSGGSTT